MSTPENLKDGALEQEAKNLEQIAAAGERVLSTTVLGFLNDIALRLREHCARESSDTSLIFDRQRAGFDRCFETLGITDDRERSWSSLVLALTDVAADAARYRFIRDDNYWHQNDRYWEALSAGGEKLDTTIDDGIKSRAESEEEEL